MFYVVVLVDLVDTEWQYVYSYHFAVHCKEYARLFLSQEQARRYLKRSDFKHCKYKITEINNPPASSN